MNISDFTQATLAGLQTTYALVNPQGKFIEHAPEFSAFLLGTQTRLIGMDFFDILPEFVGQEEEMELVKAGKLPFVNLTRINRGEREGMTRYFTFTVIPGKPQMEVAFVVLVTDVTDQGKYMQELSQSRNELSLARRRLAKLSYQLDFLVRHYLSPEITDAFLKGDLQLELGGELREVTILFADIRGFTPLAERLPANELVKILNRHLHIAAGAIEDSDGAITQFQGDNIVAIFNMFGDQPNHALNAVEAGIDLQQRIRVTHYRHRKIPEEVMINFGVGINTGTALIGNIGARQRFSYTATGNAANLAARITDITPPNEVWIGQTTKNKLPPQVRVEPLLPKQLKGKTGLTELYKVVHL